MEFGPSDRIYPRVSGDTAWAICGPIFNYSDTWQLVINTGTTVATFLMIFVLQHSQNRDSTCNSGKAG